jgi:hypothetical protein
MLGRLHFFQAPEHMNSEQQQAFLQATAWLRPCTRWAAAFAVGGRGFLPEALRNLPLKLVKQLLVHYQKRTLAAGHTPCSKHHP